MFCYHSEANSPHVRAAGAGNLWLPRAQGNVFLWLCPSLQGQSISQFKYNQQTRSVTPEKSPLFIIMQRKNFAVK